MVFDFGVNAGGLGFDSQVGQIGHSVVNGSPPLQRFFELCCPGAKLRRWIPPLVIHFGAGANSQAFAIEFEFSTNLLAKFEF